MQNMFIQYNFTINICILSHISKSSHNFRQVITQNQPKKLDIDTYV